MKIEETRIETKTTCDCCRRYTPPRIMYRNDGSFQSDYISIGEIDLCIQCAARVLSRAHQLKFSTSEEDIKKTIENLQNTCMDLENRLKDVSFFEFAGLLK